MRVSRTWRPLAPLAALLALAPPSPARAELRPLVRSMLENLASLAEIGRGVAVEDFGLVEEAASDLAERAKLLQALDAAALGIAPEQKPQFDAFLEAQRNSAAGIREAARGRDPVLVMTAMEQLERSSCIPCHTRFRDAQRLLRPSVAFMTSFLHAWQDVLRGLAINDLDLVVRRAREIQGVARVLTWNEVIAEVFNISDADQRRVFRGYVQALVRRAGEMEDAAAREDVGRVVTASRLLWTEACIACHQRFR